MKRNIVVAGALALALLGCKPDAAVRNGALINDDGTKRPIPPKIDNPGVISGVVSFAGAPPKRLVIDPSMDPACTHPAGQPLETEQYVVDGGHLANVFVYVKNGPALAMNMPAGSPEPVVLDQRGCQYVPHVIGVMAGGRVEFQNHDQTMHNIHTMPTTVGNQPVDISQGPNGAPVFRTFAKPELMLPVRCNNHPWMNAFINVSATPYFAVSDAAGRFTLPNLPPGNYQIGAVQEKLGEQDGTVTVAPNGNATLNFTFAAK